MKTVLKVLVGSRAHGTAGPDSDEDWREVFVLPTETILGVKDYAKITNKDDDTKWEIGHFCDLALKCNPSILEVLAAVPHSYTDEGMELRKLFPKFLSRRTVSNAFRGFALSQKKAVLTRNVPQGRINKFLSHYLRMLYCGCSLLGRGEMLVDIRRTPIESWVLKAKRGELELAEALAFGEELERLILENEALSSLPDEPDYDAISGFLLKVRMGNLHCDSVSMALDLKRRRWGERRCKLN
jgi:hypothetical protein